MSADPPQTNTEPDEVAELRVRAEQGDADAQYAIGVLYSDGRGVPEDEAQATAWYRKAAAQGNADAMFCLGVKYEHGLGVPQDDVQAVLWYCRAVEQGNADAMSGLGWMYAFGRGVPEDFVEAMTWMTLAAARATGKDKKRYTERRNALFQWMTRTQVVEAMKLARAWAEAFEQRRTK